MSSPGFTVRIEPAGLSFDADADRPLVDSARVAAVRLPTSCRNGTCRTCLCRATAGRVVYRVEWPGVSAEEKAEGWILPCVAHPVSDLTIEQPAARRVAPLRSVSPD